MMSVTSGMGGSVGGGVGSLASLSADVGAGVAVGRAVGLGRGVGVGGGGTGVSVGSTCTGVASSRGSWVAASVEAGALVNVYTRTGVAAVSCAVQAIRTVLRSTNKPRTLRIVISAPAALSAGRRTSATQLAHRQLFLIEQAGQPRVRIASSVLRRSPIWQPGSRMVGRIEGNSAVKSGFVCRPDPCREAVAGSKVTQFGNPHQPTS
jgi:hypothetical protein